MGNCISPGHRDGRAGVIGILGQAQDDPIPMLHREISKDMKRVMGDSYFTRGKVAKKLLSRGDLQRSYDFVELQMLLPRRHCIDTQVLVLTAAQLACCGMLLLQPGGPRSQQCCFVSNLCLHVLFETRPLQLEAHGIALASLARFLEGNTSLEKLNLNLMGITLMDTTVSARHVFTGVMESFAAMLCSNTTLRLLIFEGLLGGGGEVPWSEADAELVCKAQSMHRSNLRLAFLMGQHRRCKGASLLARHLPCDLVRKVLDLAVPMSSLCKVEFNFFPDNIQLERIKRAVQHLA